MNSHDSHLGDHTLPASIDRLLADQLAQCTQEALPDQVGELLCQLVDAGLDALPLPGEGDTLARWRALAIVASHDLSLAKLFEAHVDALAILAEAGVGDLPHLAVWGVWCAETPAAGLSARALPGDGMLVLNGEKHWCSGARAATHGLLSYRDAQGRACLAAVDLDQEGVEIVEDEWMAVGMAATRTARLRLHQVMARPVGEPGFYLRRPGFWQGGAGIAACWFGAAMALAGVMRERLAARHDDHALARLGRTECAMHGAALSLHAAAAWIDANPAADAMRTALRTRLEVEHASLQVMGDLGAALGPAPYCTRRHSARLLADLPVYLRQSHAERDLARLATLCLESEETPWLL